MKFLSTAVAAAAMTVFAGSAFAQDAAQPAQAEQAQPAAPAAFTDAQVEAFAHASLEIDPISRSLAGATPEAQTAAATQIRGILERHSLDGETYNAIAARAQADAALAERIATLQVNAQAGSQGADATAPQENNDGAAD
ncbi:MAG: DUF4168 domain-containing protein [Hyphomonadaceae bacterium]